MGSRSRDMQQANFMRGEVVLCPNTIKEWSAKIRLSQAKWERSVADREREAWLGMRVCERSVCIRLWAGEDRANLKLSSGRSRSDLTQHKEEK